MKKFGFKWALIFIGVSLLWILIEKLAGFHDSHIDKHPVFSNLFAIPAIVIFVLALLDKRKNFYKGRMSWLDGFLSGLVISVIVAILSPLVAWLMIDVISPDYFENASEYAVSTGRMTLMEAKNYFNLANYLMQSALGAVLLGAVISAIVALFVRKK
ncbi:MAG: DUF4199 domain-containing protein [Draconibacterium sp.]|nr:MAG: DUF4199 domain-containing protein [Draconibacterium sp.]